jgi:hypothetical protein
MAVDRGVEMPLNELEEMPRPVVAFLLAGCKLRPHEALAGCLRELADEGLVRYQTDGAGVPVISLGADSPRSGRPLLEFEQVALARVRGRTGRMGGVPFSALVSDDGDGYKNWTARQQEELGQEASRAGLAVKSSPKGSWRIVLTLAAAAICTVLVVHGVNWKTGDHIAPPVLSFAFLVLLVPLFLRRWRLTPDGAEAVASWRRAGRGVPGAASGLAADNDRTVWALDGPGGAPLPRGQAWSSLGGQWHTVQLGAALSRPFWSTPAALGLVLMWTLIGSLFALLIGAVGLGFDSLGKLIALTPAMLAAVVIVLLWLPAYTSRIRLPDNVTFTGEVVRLEFVDGGEDPDGHLAWIDDGSPVTMKFDVGPVTYHGLSVGQLVQVSWSPRRRALNGVC